MARAPRRRARGRRGRGKGGKRGRLGGSPRTPARTNTLGPLQLPPTKISQAWACRPPTHAAITPSPSTQLIQRAARPPWRTPRCRPSFFLSQTSTRLRDRGGRWRVSSSHRLPPPPDLTFFRRSRLGVGPRNSAVGRVGAHHVDLLLCVLGGGRGRGGWSGPRGAEGGGGRGRSGPRRWSSVVSLHGPPESRRT